MLILRHEADEILGEENSGNGNIYCGQGGYVITYPVDHGKLVNMVAIRLKEDMTWDDEQWLVPTPRKAMLDDFRGWGETIKQLLGQVQDTSRWALYNVPNVSTFYKERICLVGDSGHASTSNQGAGASMAFEDAYILSSLLRNVRTPEQINSVFKAFDAVRRPRTQRLIATSRTAVDVYGFAQEGVGDDLAKIRRILMCDMLGSGRLICRERSREQECFWVTHECESIRSSNTPLYMRDQRTMFV